MPLNCKYCLQLFDDASNLHDIVIPLLPESEIEKQNEWFWSIIKYSNPFKGTVTQSLIDSEASLKSVIPVQSDVGVTREEFIASQVSVHASSTVMSDDLQDDVKPTEGTGRR